MVDLREALRPAELDPPLPVSEIAVRARRRRRRRRTRATGLAVATLGLAALAVVRLPIVGGTDLATAGPASQGQVSTDDTGTATSYHGASGGGWDEVGEVPGSPSTTAEASSSSSIATDGTTGDGDGGGTSTETTAVSGDTAGSMEPPGEETTPAGPAPQTTPGITVATSTPSEWDTGYCLRVEVTNGTTGPISWQVVLDLDGTIDSVWSATVEPAADGSLVFHGELDYNDTLDGGATTAFGTCLTTGGA